jgi:hypothetical protein
MTSTEKDVPHQTDVIECGSEQLRRRIRSRAPGDHEQFDVHVSIMARASRQVTLIGRTDRPRCGIGAEVAAG